MGLGGEYRFGPFQVRTGARELSKGGTKIKLRGQPYLILEVLLGRAGEVVTREEIREKLWPADTFVDFEHGLNTSVKKLRQVLCDSAEEPLYIETVPRLGYRFIAPVEVVTESTNSPAEVPDLQRLKRDSDSGRAAAATARFESNSVAISTRFRWAAVTGATMLVIGLAVGGWLFFSRKARALTDKDTIVLADFANTTGDEVFDGTLKQALAVDLGQSPFLNILSEDKVRQTLRQMTRPPGERLTQDLAREVCQRTGSKAYLSGSIAALGTQYVIGLSAVNCQTGDALAEEQERATGKEQVLAALDKAAGKLRNEVGESLGSVQKFDVPLAQATTNSLEALKAYTLAVSTAREKGYPEALQFYKRAIELDPNFALAYSDLGVDYYNLNQPSAAADYLTKAFDLR
ncbi:MAG: winged helix-turn-helix domain-containing protein, partial [Candidatus Acidiferrum sp.]